jgi:hypothetical protein
MSAPEIQIENIYLDLRGVAPGVAREALASLGPALGRAMAARNASAGDFAATAPIRLAAGADASTLRDALAQRLVATISNRTNSR